MIRIFFLVSKIIIGLLGVLIITRGFANNLVVVKDNVNTQVASNYLQDITLPTQENINETLNEQGQNLSKVNTDESITPLLLPAKNDFIPGQVIKHQLATDSFGDTPIFIIGTDENSVNWARTNANYLKSIHAMGFLSQVASVDEKKEIENKAGLTLISSNLNGLSSIIGTNHYPVLVYKKWVLQ